MSFNLFKFLFLFAGISLLLTDVTDADLIDKKTLTDNQLNATTLDFSNLNTINNQNQQILFDIKGILPNGFTLNTFRLKNTGESNIKYQLNFRLIDGDQNFCQNLDLKLTQENTQKFQGKLTDLNIEIPQVSNNQSNDWIFMLALNHDDVSIKSKSCNFAIDIFGWQTNQPKNLGFSHQRSLIGQVTSGDW